MFKLDAVRSVHYPKDDEIILGHLQNRIGYENKNKSYCIIFGWIMTRKLCYNERARCYRTEERRNCLPKYPLGGTNPLVLRTYHRRNCKISTRTGFEPARLTPTDFESVSLTTRTPCRHVRQWGQEEYSFDWNSK